MLFKLFHKIETEETFSNSLYKSIAPDIQIHAENHNKER